MFGEYEKFVVRLSLQNDKGMCKCQIFEFIGIPCRHNLKGFVRLDTRSFNSFKMETRGEQI